MAATLPSAISLNNEMGIRLDTDFTLASHRIRSYLMAALSHEFARDNRAEINNTKFCLPNSGTQGKYGLGSVLDIADDIFTYAEMRYQKGNKTESVFNTTIGLRVSF